MLVRIITVMVGLGPHQTSSHHAESANINRASSITSSMKIIWISSRRAARRRSMLVEVVIDEGVIWYMNKLMKKTCNEKLMI